MPDIESKSWIISFVISYYSLEELLRDSAHYSGLILAIETRTWHARNWQYSDSFSESISSIISIKFCISLLEKFDY